MRQREIGKYVPKQIKVYWLTYSRWDGSHLEFDPNKLQLNQVIISPFGGKTVGYELSQIIRDGKNIGYAIPNLWAENFVDITDWFFNTYERDGRCIFDRDHVRWMLGNNDRFTYVNNTRKCNWCSKWHTKKIEKVTEIKRVEKWV